MMTQSMVVAGSPAWLKRYAAGRRRLRLAALDAVACRLDLWPLRPPPHHGGTHARQVEARRIAQLDALGVRVPNIIGESSDALLLSDIGPTLASRMRDCAQEPARLDALTAAAIAAIAAAHRRGAYLGQPWPRNLTLHDGEVGFIDFEEDPLEVMTLEQAQARDWLLFAYGATGFYRDRPDALTRMLRQALREAPHEVITSVGRVGARLQPLTRVLDRFGLSAAAFSLSIMVIRSATAPVLVLLALLLGLDWLGDGDFDLLPLLI